MSSAGLPNPTLPGPRPRASPRPVARVLRRGHTSAPQPHHPAIANRRNRPRGAGPARVLLGVQAPRVVPPPRGLPAHTPPTAPARPTVHAGPPKHLQARMTSGMGHTLETVPLMVRVPTAPMAPMEVVPMETPAARPTASHLRELRSLPLRRGASATDIPTAPSPQSSPQSSPAQPRATAAPHAKEPPHGTAPLATVLARTRTLVPSRAQCAATASRL